MNDADRIPIAPSLKQREATMPPIPGAMINKRVFYLSLQAIFNALLIGVVARVLVYLISFVTNLAFYGRVSFEEASPAGHHWGWFVVFVPIIGSVVVGLMARYGSPAIRGHGIPEAMEKIILDESRIPPIIAILKPLSAAISIGTGGPFGAEGPIIATGGALGSFSGQWMHISSSERKIMLAAGACAGMSAIFGSPLAAVLLAIELLLFEFSPRSIIPVALACITGAGMHIALFGSTPVFAMPDIPVATNSGLLLYAGLGVLIGVIASLVSKSVYAVEDLFEKLPIHWMWWPAIGAVAVGVIGYFAPFTMGVGYDNIQHLLTGNMALTMLLSLCLLKYISWVIALGSGTSGGTLAPLFTIGGALGALLGVGVLHFFPTAEIDVATCALIGMAAMFAGASRAVLTAIIFSLETTGQHHGLMPLLAACIAAYFVSFFLMKGSIMTEKILRRGVRTPDAFSPDVLENANVRDIFLPAPPQAVGDDMITIAAGASIAQAAALMGQHKVKELHVLEQPNHIVTLGTLSADAILAYYAAQQEKENRYQSPLSTRKLIVRGRRAFY